MKKDNGITLIALIITIIVMLILVAVSVNVAMNGGIFDRARNAKTGMDDSRIYEEMLSAVIGYSGGSEMTAGDIDQLKTELERIKGVQQPIEGTTFPLTVTSINGGKWKIKSSGTIKDLTKLDPNWYIPEDNEISELNASSNDISSLVAQNSSTNTDIYFVCRDESGYYIVVTNEPETGHCLIYIPNDEKTITYINNQYIDSNNETRVTSSGWYDSSSFGWDGTLTLYTKGVPNNIKNIPNNEIVSSSYLDKVILSLEKNASSTSSSDNQNVGVNETI